MTDVQRYGHCPYCGEEITRPAGTRGRAPVTCGADACKRARKADNKRAERAGEQAVTEPAGGFGDLAYTAGAGVNEFAADLDDPTDFGDGKENAGYSVTSDDPKHRFDIPVDGDEKYGRRDPAKEYGVGGRGEYNFKTGYTSRQRLKPIGSDETVQEAMGERPPAGQAAGHDSAVLGRLIRDARRRIWDLTRQQSDTEFRDYMLSNGLTFGQTWEEFCTPSLSDLHLAAMDYPNGFNPDTGKMSPEIL